MKRVQFSDKLYIKYFYKDEPPIYCSNKTSHKRDITKTNSVRHSIFLKYLAISIVILISVCVLIYAALRISSMFFLNKSN